LLPWQSDDILPFLGHLMNLRFGGDLDTRLEHYSAEQIKYQTMMRLRDLLVALARQERLMLVLEDLHWADDLSLDLLSLLMDELIAHPLMLVCVYRPEREHRVWRLGSMAQRKCLERYTEISLQKLHPRESRRLVQELLAIDNLPESVRGVILSKSEGNPFFIEEVIRSLIERGLVYRDDDRWKAREDIVELEVPDTIQSVVLARVDRLEAEAKHVLQCASVIGRLFKHRLLEHLTQKQQELDRCIIELEERDLVYEERTVPELEYAFKHALTQEATYQGILEQRRRVFHREVALGIERLYQERIEDFYEELAYHWGRSGEREKTLEYLMKAGGKAAKHYLNEVAVDYYTRAIQLAEDMGVSGDRLAEIYEARGQVYGDITFYEEHISDMMEAARLYTRRRERAKMYQEIARTYQFFIVDAEEAIRYARRALEEIDPADKSRDAASTYEGAASIFIYSIDLEEGKRLLGKAIAISEEMGYKDLLAAHYTMLVWMYYFYPRSEELAKERQFAREKALRYMPYIKHDLANYANMCAILGNNAEGDEHMHLGHEALDSGIKSGNGWAVVLAASLLGPMYRDRGEIQKAIEVYEQGWRLGVRVRFISWSYMLDFAKELMSLYVSNAEPWKLVEMMFQMVDSTLVLHRKPEVYSIVQSRWNDTVEEIYEELHNIAPEVYRELEHSLESRLSETDNDGERFFYHGQLILLDLLDGRRQDVEAHVQKLLKVCSRAGRFAQRISKRVEYAIELMGIPPKQRQTAALNLLKSVDQFEDLQKALEVIGQVLSDDVVAQVIDWDLMEQLVIDCLQEQVSVHAYGSRAIRSWFAAVTIYERYGHGDKLQMLAEQVQQEMPGNLREAGITQLLLEPVRLGKPGLPEFIDQFAQDSLANDWEWVNPAEDCSYELDTEGYLQITVPPNHSIHQWYNYKGPRFLREMRGDFVMETCLTDGFKGKKSGGLLVWRDKDNFIRLEVPSSTEWEDTVYYEATVAGKLIYPGAHKFETEKAWLRLERKGDRFAGYVSADGENWYRCGWADIPMQDPIQVGIHALCPQSPTTSTRFEYFKILRAR